MTWREKTSLKKTQHDVKFIKYKGQFRGVGGRLGVAFLIKAFYVLENRLK